MDLQKLQDHFNEVRTKLQEFSQNDENKIHGQPLLLKNIDVYLKHIACATDKVIIEIDDDLQTIQENLRYIEEEKDLHLKIIEEKQAQIRELQKELFLQLTATNDYFGHYALHTFNF